MPSLINLHLGMALARRGDKAGATAALNAVTGPRAEIAKYWLALPANAGLSRSFWDRAPGFRRPIPVEKTPCPACANSGWLSISPFRRTAHHENGVSTGLEGSGISGAV